MRHLRLLVLILIALLMCQTGALASDFGDRVKDMAEVTGVRVSKQDSKVRIVVEADKEVDQKVDHGSVAADRCHGVFAAEVADDQGIRCIEDLLQDTGQSDGNSKLKDLIPQTSLQHIDRTFHKYLCPLVLVVKS